MKTIDEYTIYSTEDLIDKQKLGEQLSFYYFWGHTPKDKSIIDKSCLSQWFQSLIIEGNVGYSSAEQYMMAHKALLFKDHDTYEKIMKEKEPKKIKALGRQVKNFDESIWRENCERIVIQGNYLKFRNNYALRDFLLSTGDDILVEASPYDSIWGVKMSMNDSEISNPIKWKGTNLLGFCLMAVRDKLKLEADIRNSKKFYIHNGTLTDKSSEDSTILNIDSISIVETEGEHIVNPNDDCRNFIYSYDKVRIAYQDEEFKNHEINIYSTINDNISDKFIKFIMESNKFKMFENGNINVFLNKNIKFNISNSKNKAILVYPEYAKDDLKEFYKTLKDNSLEWDIKKKKIEGLKVPFTTLNFNNLERLDNDIFTEESRLKFFEDLMILSEKVINKIKGETT